jgi:hypothetical protein
VRGLRLPPAVATAVKPISQTLRLTLIRRVHDDESIPLQDRVVALLILLYAQPLIKIAGLTVADVVLDGGQVLVRLGAGDPVPIVPPFSDVLLDHIATRSNRTTATNPAARCCSPAAAPANPSTPARCDCACTGLVSRTSTAGLARSASWFCRRRHRLWPACSATTPPESRSWRRKPARPGSVTPQTERVQTQVVDLRVAGEFARAYSKASLPAQLPLTWCTAPA